jgi:hypothetical protein
LEPQGGKGWKERGPLLLFKEMCHEMNKFLKALKVKSVLYVYAPMGLKYIWCLVLEKLEIQVFACFYKNTYLVLKITETLFKMLVAAFRKTPVIL